MEGRRVKRKGRQSGGRGRDRDRRNLRELNMLCIKWCSILRRKVFHQKLWRRKLTT